MVNNLLERCGYPGDNTLRKILPTGNFRKTRETSRRETSGKRGKLPDGKLPVELRGIRETSRRETFHRWFMQQYAMFFYKNAL